MIRRSRPLKLKPGSRRIRHFVLHHGDMKYPLIADSRLRISDLQLMNNFSNRTIRNLQSAIRNPQSEIRNSTESPCPLVSPW